MAKKRRNQFGLQPSGSETSEQKREVIDLAFNIINFAFSLYEEFHIQDLYQRQGYLASVLQNFLTQQSSMWTTQNHINWALQKEIDALAPVVVYIGNELAYHELITQIPCHYRYKPLCVTPLQVNLTNSSSVGSWLRIRAALQGTLLSHNASSDIHQLALLLQELRNISTDFSNHQTAAFNIANYLKHLQFLQWLFSWIGPVAILFLLCIFGPRLIRFLISLMKTALINIKADTMSLIHRTPRSARI
ncbi:uncharacterized protein LOC141499800 [Macrotis lagotis]|uniref:uncharacterized protein LOC141499800 n=1 Tax=Macrotis lagotis TaxID=92651 RepID=UPI003D689D03